MTEEQLKEELIRLEEHYGNGDWKRRHKRRSVSPHDPRNIEKLNKGGMMGADRMKKRVKFGGHNYAYLYAKHLIDLLDDGFHGDTEENVIVEVGVLRGSGVATWSHLFPHHFVYGLDIDLSYIEENMSFLTSRGAFRNEKLKLYEYDQFIDNKEYVKEILGGKKVKLMIDDGFHSNLTILNTLDVFVDHLAEDFVYFIEDNKKVHPEIREKYSQFSVFYENQLTILTPK